MSTEKENELLRTQTDALRTQKESAHASLALAQGEIRAKQNQNDSLIKNVADLTKDLRESQATKTMAMQMIAVETSGTDSGAVMEALKKQRAEYEVKRSEYESKIHEKVREVIEQHKEQLELVREQREDISRRLDKANEEPAWWA